MGKFRGLILLLALLLLAGGWFLARTARSRSPLPTSAAPAEGPHRALYVELIETNHDTFEHRLFINATEVPPAPFRFRENRIAMAPGVGQAIAQGTHPETFRLTLDRPDLDPARDAWLFLVHEVRYDGVGRVGGHADYYAFTSTPARVTLPAAEQAGGDLVIGLDESIGKTFALRFFPGASLTFALDGAGQLTVAADGASQPLPEEGEVQLSQEARTVSIRQTLLAPVPKGPVIPEQLDTIEETLGPVQCSTELLARNRGLLEVVGDASP